MPKPPPSFIKTMQFHGASTRHSVAGSINRRANAAPVLPPCQRAPRTCVNTHNVLHPGTRLGDLHAPCSPVRDVLLVGGALLVQGSVVEAHVSPLLRLQHIGLNERLDGADAGTWGTHKQHTHTQTHTTYGQAASLCTLEPWARRKTHITNFQAASLCTVACAVIVIKTRHATTIPCNNMRGTGQMCTRTS